MVEGSVGGGHGEAGDSPSTLVVNGEVVTAEQIESVEKATAPKVKYHPRSGGAVRTHDSLSGPTIKDLIQKSISDESVRDKLRAHAALIAIDMERGVYAKGEKKWLGGYSREEIMRVMGYHVKSSGGQHYPVIFREPEWSRALEWERIRRDVNYRMEMDALMPMLRVGLSGMLVELVRRVMLAPESIPTHVLIPEARKLMDVVAEFGKQKKDQPVDQVINNFIVMVKELPEEAREIALQAFRSEMREIAASTDHAKEVLQSEPHPGRKSAA